MSTANKQMLCLTICGYKLADMSEDDYRDYMIKNHVPLVRGLMVKHGISSYSMTHNQTSTRALIDEIFEPGFISVADYDCFIQIQFRDVQQFIAFKSDPEYKRLVHGDHENFMDIKKTTMSIGYVSDIIRDGVVVEN
ncbi:EthD domain-containing protein [Poronia punctata]|nr:EthD domain-containing protein [Poronia punctata]